MSKLRKKETLSLIGFTFAVFLLCSCIHLSIFSIIAQAEEISAPHFRDPISVAAESPQWLRLLHYDQSLIFGRRSLNDGSQFFFSPQGKTDPEAELRATIEAMNDPSRKIGRLSLHPQCAFPARRRYLNQSLNIELETSVDCEKLEQFLLRFKDPQSVSVVFSTAYPNNPASMFGHSFLKFQSKSGSDLTDLGINYAARVPPSEHSLAFMYFGIFGGYRGQWSTETYHQKVKEYALSENRDLWEYELSLSPQETIFLIEHIWELENNGHFAYYFFDENCSYHILAAIEAIRADWNLTQHKVYVIPGESIKSLTSQPGAVRQVRFRPGAQSSWQSIYDNLSREERRQFRHIFKTKQINGTESMQQLNGLIQFMRYLEAKRKGKLTRDETGFQHTLWRERAKRGAEPEPTTSLMKHLNAPSTRPDQGHDAYAVKLGQTVRRRRDLNPRGQTTQLKIKSAYHDLLNRDMGYKPFSHIDFPSLQVQYDSDLREIRLDELRLLSISSLNPFEFGSRGLSWRFDSGLETARDYGCLSCRHLFIEGGLGLSLNLWSRKNIFYLMGLARPEAYRGLDQGHRLLTGFEAGLLLNPTEVIKSQFGLREMIDLSRPQRSSKQLRYWFLQASYSINRQLELRAEIDFLQPAENPQFQQRQYTLSLITFFR